MAYPIGSVYTQYPNQESPNDLWGAVSTWVEQDYGGAFFRASGGNAQAFANQTAMQAGQNKYHRHGFANNAKVSEKSLTGNYYPYSSSGAGADSTAAGSMGASGIFSKDAMTATGIILATGTGNNKIYRLHIDATHDHSLSSVNTAYDGDSNNTENRPSNYTYIIWKRTS